MKSKIPIILTIIVLAFVVVSVIIKVDDTHKSKQYSYTLSLIIEAAKKCQKDNKCVDSKITLKELYDNDYLEKMANPKTKKYFNENSYVLMDESDPKLEIVE